MEKRPIPFLAIAITIALSGLVFIQWRWISGTIQLKDRQFNEIVDNALVSVSDRLEHVEAMQGFKRHEFGRSMIERIEADADMMEPLHEDSTVELAPPLLDSGGTRSDWSRVYDERDSVIADMVRGLFSTRLYGSITDRVDPRMLDSLIHDELDRHGIDERCDYGIFSARGRPELVQLNEGSDTMALANSPHSTRLFRNDLIGEQHWLRLHLPDQQRLVLRSMWPMLTASAVFILLIVAAFVFTLLTIRRQRQLSEIKNDLVNNLTHELKTPISTIALACEALNDPSIPKSPDQMKVFTNMIRDENKRLGLLVESVLQSAVADSGRMRLRIADVDLHAVLNDVVRNGAISAENRGGRVELHSDAELSHVRGDRIHLSNVFYNLLDNAVKYCEREPVVRFSTSSDARGVTINVRDNGIGIPRNEQRKIFDRLYRVPTGDRHNVKGFGLGLSYVKAVVERHGGTITVESEPGAGSTFRITIPFEHGERDQAVAV